MESRCTMKSYILDFLGAHLISNLVAFNSVSWIFISENMAILIHLDHLFQHPYLTKKNMRSREGFANARHNSWHIGAN